MPQAVKKKDIPRQPMPEQAPEDRVKNFDEVPYGFTEELARLETMRCILCKNPKCVAACPVARKYLDLLGSLDWEHFPERDRHRPWPGATPAPRAPFVAAYLVKLDQDKRYMSDLRSYLVDHPALVWVLGFPLVASTAQPWGFDVKASVPSRK